MPEVHKVTAIVSNPTRAGDNGRVTLGFYTLADGLLTMTDGEWGAGPALGRRAREAETSAWRRCRDGGQASHVEHLSHGER
jgi:hypothetical protein